MEDVVKGLVVLVAFAAFCQESTNGQPRRAATPGRTRHILQDFDASLGRIDALLAKGNPKKAYSQCSLLLRDMEASLIGGPGVGQLLGVATVRRALAAYELGREDEALWHWHVATQMYPAVADLEMMAAGEAAEFLKSRPLGTIMASETPPDDSAVEPPTMLRGPTPSFPWARRRSEHVTVIVSVVVDENGRPHEPRILQSEDELTMVYATLDSLRHWEFEPARQNGIPVPMTYRVEVDFRP